ncbi:hypothetical protein BKA70DRAFT_1344238 [Coprinopsis sp. MPI-PUGE-AT-0042]|nr:hypothetical protein BKA70DRAFT_1344238 [Coprinopsis sp. MPI-PUGE-AT-0042]
MDIHELVLCSQPYTVPGLRGPGSRELEKPAHALPLSQTSQWNCPHGWHIPTTRLERCSRLFMRDTHNR